MPIFEQPLHTAMKQPELGATISTIRKQRGITQKDLAESCNIDIRTLQRIESGSVTPRMSTLKLVAEALSWDFRTLQDEKQENPTGISMPFLGFIFAIGVLFFVNWLFVTPWTSLSPASLLGKHIPIPAEFFLTTYAFSGIIFYYGINRLGKYHGNLSLQISSVVIMVCLPLFLISVLIATQHNFGKHLISLVVLLMSINSILLGIGLFTTKSALKNWYKVAGILQLLIAPFFLIQLRTTQFIGFCLSVPFLLLLLVLVLLEYRQCQKITAPHRPLH